MEAKNKKTLSQVCSLTQIFKLPFFCKEIFDSSEKQTSVVSNMSPNFLSWAELSPAQKIGRTSEPDFWAHWALSFNRRASKLKGWECKELFGWCSLVADVFLFLDPPITKFLTGYPFVNTMVGSLAKNKNFDVKNVPKMMEMDTFSEKSGSAAQA